ncbi:MAG TPA: glycosyltransferase [Polyangiaceae bacterium]
MKALLVPVGSRGDVQPQLLLGAELMRRGHAVTIAAPPDFAEAAGQRGFRFIPIGDSIMELLVNNSGMTERHPLVALPGQIALLRRNTERSVRDLFAAEHDADVVVSAGLSLGGKMLADKLGVPHVFCCYSLSAMHSAEHAPAVMPVFGLPKLVNRALWGTFTQLFELGLGGVLNNLRRQVGLKAYRGSWLAIHGSEVILAQDEVIGKLPGDVPGSNVQVPAIVASAEQARPLPDLLERFLRGAGDGPAGASPVVYLGFGSMPSVDRGRVVQMACELFEQHGARVVLFLPGAPPESELPPGVFAIGDTDHAALFPRVDLIVHHGGAGTTATALRAGVPQLVVPHIVDQFFHGRRMAELGVGPAPIPKAKLDAAAIATALKARFGYWAKAQTVRTSVVAAGGAARAATHLEQLAAAAGRA